MTRHDADPELKRDEATNVFFFTFAIVTEINFFKHPRFILEIFPPNLVLFLPPSWSFS